MKYRIIGPNDPALAVLEMQLKSHPEWETELTIIPWAEYQSLMVQALQAPTSPYQAVCVPGHIWMPGLVKNGYLKDLDTLIPQLPKSLVAHYQPEDIIPAIARESRQDGKQYFLPLFTDGHIIFYRKDLFPKLDNDGVPVINAIQIHQLLEQAVLPAGMLPFALKAHASEILTDWLPYFWAAKADMTNEQNQPTFDSPAAIYALDYYRSLRKFCPSDTDQFGNAEIASLLKEGKVAMAVTWGGQAAVVMDESNPYRDVLGTAVFEKPWNATWGICIPANLPPEVQLGMLAILFAAADPHQDRMVTKIAGSPVRKSSYQIEECSKYSWLNAQKAMLDRCGMLPVNPEFARYIGPLYEAVYLAFTGQLSAEEALTKASNS